MELTITYKRHGTSADVSYAVTFDLLFSVDEHDQYTAFGAGPVLSVFQSFRERAYGINEGAAEALTSLVTGGYTISGRNLDHLEADRTLLVQAIQKLPSYWARSQQVDRQKSERVTLPAKTDLVH